MGHVECFGSANAPRSGRTQYARPRRGGSREAVHGQGGAHVTTEARHEGAERRGTGGLHRVGGGGTEDTLGRRPGRRQHARGQPASVLVSGLHGVCHYQICVQASRGVFEARTRGTEVGKGARVTGMMGGARAPSCSRGGGAAAKGAIPPTLCPSPQPRVSNPARQYCSTHRQTMHRDQSRAEMYHARVPWTHHAKASERRPSEQTAVARLQVAAGKIEAQMQGRWHGEEKSCAGGARRAQRARAWQEQDDEVFRGLEWGVVVRRAQWLGEG